MYVLRTFISCKSVVHLGTWKTVPLIYWLEAVRNNSNIFRNVLSCICINDIKAILVRYTNSFIYTFWFQSCVPHLTNFSANLNWLISIFYTLFYPWAIYCEGRWTFNSHITVQDGRFYGSCHLIIVSVTRCKTAKVVVKPFISNVVKFTFLFSVESEPDALWAMQDGRRV